MLQYLTGVYILTEDYEIAGVYRERGHCIEVYCNRFDTTGVLRFSDLIIARGRSERGIGFTIHVNRVKDYIKTGKLIKYKNSEE